MLHVAMKAFHPGKPPFPLLHVDTTWKFREMIAFRDETARRLGLDLIVHINEDGVKRGISPIASGSQLHTQVMKTEALRQALDRGRFDAAFGGARRDEEKSRAKERIFSFRSAAHAWDPRNQRPELWRLFNTRLREGELMRVFPLSNWTELDVWEYVLAEDIPVVPLYFSKLRPVVERSGALIMVDDDRLPLEPGETADNAAGALPHPRLLSANRRNRVRSRHAARHRRRNAQVHHLRTPGPPYRCRRSLVDGEEKARRVLLMRLAPFTMVPMVPLPRRSAAWEDDAPPSPAPPQRSGGGRPRASAVEGASRP